MGKGIRLKTMALIFALVEKMPRSIKKHTHLFHWECSRIAKWIGESISFIDVQIIDTKIF